MKITKKRKKNEETLEELETRLRKFALKTRVEWIEHKKLIDCGDLKLENESSIIIGGCDKIVKK
jgi:hypothetical protein